VSFEVVLLISTVRSSSLETSSTVERKALVVLAECTVNQTESCMSTSMTKRDQHMSFY
jgi:hypothetical protein